MKIALLNDTHIGARNDSDVFLDYQQAFFRDIFFPYMEKNNISHILHLGDLFDRRKYINFKTLQRADEFFFKPLNDKNITVDIIVGNHDTYYKDHNRINSVGLLATKYNNIEVIWDKPVTKKYDGIDIALIPWITRTNYEECLNHIKKTKAHICAGHFDIIGFEYMPGVESHEGLKSNVFKKFEQVWSGHYHGKYSRGNIHYLGTQFEMTWSDCGVSKGFHIFDTDTEELEFIVNPNQLFVKIYYDEEKISNIEDFDFNQYHDKYVKVTALNKTNHFTFDHFIDRLNMSHPIDISIIEEVVDQHFDDSILDDEAQDTITILDNYVDQIENISNNKSRIKKILHELYNEALAAD